MRQNREPHQTYSGLIADTMELPPITDANPDQAAAEQPPRRRRYSLLVALVAIVGSFALGLAVRVIVGGPNLGPKPEAASSGPQSRRVFSPLPVSPGIDILQEFGRTVEVPMFVQQVLPFMPRGGSPKYQVLGGYLLDADGDPDKGLPLMVVFATQDIGPDVEAETVVVINGSVVMANEAQQTASSLLTPEQERDLLYIVQRVNFWDRVTLLGTAAKTQ